MKTKRFLFPTDLSELSSAALDTGLASQGELLIVHIEGPMSSGGNVLLWRGDARIQGGA